MYTKEDRAKERRDKKAEQKREDKTEIKRLEKEEKSIASGKKERRETFLKRILEAK